LFGLLANCGSVVGDAIHVKACPGLPGSSVMYLPASGPAETRAVIGKISGLKLNFHMFDRQLDSDPNRPPAHDANGALGYAVEKSRKKLRWEGRVVQARLDGH
jgi:hypothetical protein